MPHLTRLHRSRIVIRFALAPLVAAFIAIGVVRAQQQAAPPPPPPAPAPSGQQPFKAGTNFVRVDVYPSRGGLPVENLTVNDFEVTEDGKPQKIETFEHITIEPAVQAERIEPSSPSQANQLAADPHRRVFVIYLDVQHVSIEGAHAINEPLIEFLTKTLGPDDLVGIMTPRMSVDQITFGRRTQVIEDGLRKNWPWGVRDTIKYDETEEKYIWCYPPLTGEPGPVSALAQALINRRRERIALDSLRELVLWLGTIREGRTAVVTVTEGWLLYTPNSKLTEIRKDPQTGRDADPLPGRPQPIGVGPGGVLTTKDPSNPYATERRECEVATMELSMTDNTKYFRDILGDANRANVSFYPIDPRGLPVFDNAIGPAPPPPITVDRAMLTTRLDHLRELAANTDGIALLDNNDLRSQMRRLAADLTSYYLIGYSSTNTKLDGNYRRIRVRVKQPNVTVRARGGYRAATAAELATAQKTPVGAPAAARPAALSTELGALERDRRTQPADVPAAKSTDVAGEPIFFRRGPLTANLLQRSPNRQFSRTERLHVEMLPGSATSWTAALLDRNGKALPVAVRTGERVDETTGQRWLTADLTLAPLGAGEYGLELTTQHNGQEQKILRAIRVTQ